MQYNKYQHIQQLSLDIQRLSGMALQAQAFGNTTLLAEIENRLKFLAAEVANVAANNPVDGVFGEGGFCDDDAS